MPGPFLLDYLVFVFLVSLGVLQTAAAYSGLRGLLFVKARPLAFLLGLATAALAFSWFFLSEPRNISDTEGGLDGNQMSGFFAAGAGTAFLITLLLSSLSNRSMGGNGQRPRPGLDALRETTYLKALAGTLKVRWKR